MKGCVLLLFMVVTAASANGRDGGVEHPKNPGKPIRYGKPADPETIACSSSTQPNVLTTPTGIFGSPNYPFDYPNNAHCSWSIDTPGPVMIAFPHFNTENGADQVHIFDGASADAHIVSYTGNLGRAGPVNGSIPGLLVEFLSDDANAAPGFEAKYTTDKGCFGGSGEHADLTGTGTFTSPYYPAATFSGGDNCLWLILTGDEDQSGSVTFDYFNLGTYSGGSCVDAYLWYQDSNHQAVYLCGPTNPGTIYFTDFIDFHFVAPADYTPSDNEAFSARYIA